MFYFFVTNSPTSFQKKKKIKKQEERKVYIISGSSKVIQIIKLQNNIAIKIQNMGNSRKTTMKYFILPHMKFFQANMKSEGRKSYMHCCAKPMSSNILPKTQSTPREYNGTEASPHLLEASPYLLGIYSCNELTRTIPMGSVNKNYSKEVKVYLKVTIICS